MAKPKTPARRTRRLTEADLSATRCQADYHCTCENGRYLAKYRSDGGLGLMEFRTSAACTRSGPRAVVVEDMRHIGHRHSRCWVRSRACRLCTCRTRRVPGLARRDLGWLEAREATEPWRFALSYARARGVLGDGRVQETRWLFFLSFLFISSCWLNFMVWASSLALHL